MKSPFIYGNTVNSKGFTNRTAEKEKLYHNFKSQINTTIISPRRWGKSSLVEHVAQYVREKEKDYRVVIIDLFSVYSEVEFLELYARAAILASTSKWDEIVSTSQEIFKKLIPRISMSVGPGEFSLEFDQDEIIKHKDEIINLPETLAKQKKLKFVICIDEFQNIINFDTNGQLEKALRSYWQRHKHTVYCLYGSKRHMMTDIFNDPSRPFYRFGDLLLLSKISTEDWIKYITNSFKRTQKKISKAHAQYIADMMKNHSWYVQQYAHYTWLRADKEVTQDNLDQAFQEIKRTHIPFFQQIIENLSGTQVNTIKAILSGETKLTSVAVMHNYSLGTPNNVRKNIIVLSDKDIIDRYEDGYIFLDPVLEYLVVEKLMSN